MTTPTIEPAPAAQFATDLRFWLNGAEVILEQVDPTVLLVDWLRAPRTGLTGTKKSCAQGGCGACTVMLSRWDAKLEQAEHVSINSCLHPLCALDGMELTTVEGTGNCRTELSPVQYRIAKENGSQCGFCTPGFVMNMHAFLAVNQDRYMSQKEIEDIFDGNLCRCTGYRSILYGMKHFASDWGPEDEVGCLHTKVDPAEVTPHAKHVTVSFPPALMKPPRAVHYSKGGYHWYRPVTLAQVHTILAAQPDAANVRLVGGNTSIGVYDRFTEDPHVFIDISQLAELSGIEATDAALRMGAAVTYSEFLDALNLMVANAPVERRTGLESLQYMARRTAGTIVRNAATLAGNTMLVVRHVAQGEPFPSDMFTALCALDAKVEISLAEDRRVEMPILDFANQYQNSGELQHGVLVRYAVPWTRQREFARLYKTALREENAHSIVNAGLRVRFTEAGTVEEVSIVFGGIGPVAFHAKSAEECLRGRVCGADSLREALCRVREDVENNLRENKQRMSGLMDEGFTDAYKIHLAESDFYQFFVYVAEQIAPASIPPEVKSAGERADRPVSKGKQSYESYKDEYPVNLPIIKLGAFLQATGEAVYTHDIPLPERGFEAAVVTSTAALANISYRIPTDGGYQATDAAGLIVYLQRQYPGFRDYVTASDIPSGGYNGPADDLYFAGTQVSYVGQCIGLVLADTEQLAIEIAYFISNSCIAYASAGTPILSIETARKANSIFADEPPYPVHIWKLRRPASDLDPAWTEAADGASSKLDGVSCQVVRGSQQTGSQLHFYMETHSCVAVPGERDEIVVYPSSQSPDSVHGTIHSILNIPATRVDVKIQRVGGGYGGKTTRSPYTAAITAVAAWKHHRPVRLAIRRENDSAMVGHRHPIYGEYAVAIGDGQDFASNKGLLLGMKTDFYLDGGASYDCSFVVMDCIQLRCDSAYMVPNYQTSGDVCRTNKASNTAMRSMGLVQAMLVQEDAIEKAAHGIGMSAEDVRRRNLYKQGEYTPFGQVVDYCYLDKVWERIRSMSDYDARRIKVEEFNRANRWKKRGISMIPVKYGSGYNLTSLEQAGALVEVYSQDGSVLIRHGGVEMGQGLVTKVAQIAAKELNLPLELIETSNVDTQVVPNPISTGASTGTAFNGGAVKEACGTLRSTLENFCLGLLRQNGRDWCREQGINFWDYAVGWRHKLNKKHGGGTVWHNIIKLAYNSSVDLSAQARFLQPGGGAIDNPESLIFKPGVTELVNQFTGFTFSAACTEVEVNVLTGETTILRADLVYDMGKSLNPAVDIGQVEGAYIQGLGYVLSEEVLFQPDGPNIGALNTDNTWRYKVPATTTIPLEFNVDLFPRDLAPEVPENPNDLYSSKEVGEPPLVLAITAYFALKQAVLAARRERGHDEWFYLEAPATVQRVREACLVEASDLTI